METFDSYFPQSFTVRHDGITNELRTEILVSQAFDPVNATPPPGRSYIGIWDTGATNSVISRRVVQDCSLLPIDMVQVRHAGGISQCNVFLVSLGLPNGVGIPLLSVTEGAFEEDDYDLLIGMDIINRGDFAVTNKNEQTLFSFRYPATGHIDFVQEDKKIFENARRNDPCPCGSGKKFKQCHGKKV